MRILRLASCSLALLWLSASLPQILAAAGTTDSKTHSKAKKPKPAPKPKTTARKSKAKPKAVAKTNRSTTPKPKSTSSSKTVAPAPLPPLNSLRADIPASNLAASVWRGCLDPDDLPGLASRLAMDRASLELIVSKLGLLSTNQLSPCAPYVAAAGGAGGAASAVFRIPEPKPGESPIVDLRKSADGITITPAACDCPDSVRRTLAFPVADAARRPELLASVPANIRWQLDTLVPKMISRLPASTRPEDFTMRIAIERLGGDTKEHLQSIEIVDSATPGKLVDGVWWLGRPTGPGVLIGTDGVALERLLWQSPLKYAQMSRGVGPAVTTYRSASKTKGRFGRTIMRTFSVREYHLGADLGAPMGTEVHAVADAKVSFAGKMGGYGNLIILDHGLGYQTYYAHLSVILPETRVGAPVARGDLIGLVGSTGRSTGPHLHFETRKDSKFIDPFDNTRQWDFWQLTPDDQEHLAMELLALPRATISEEDSPAPPAAEPPQKRASRN